MNTWTSQPSVEHPVEANGTVLWVEQRGGGPDVLLLAGFTDQHGAWQRQLDGLCDSYRLTAPDNRGVGRSPLPADGVSIVQMADDAAALVRALEIEHAHVCGFSMGGMIAQELVLRHPELARTLTLVGAHPRADTHLRTWLHNTLAMAAADPPERDFIESFLLWVYSDRMYEEDRVRPIVDALLADPYPQSPESFAAHVRAICEHDALDRLPSIDVPTLVVSGTEDFICPPRLSRQVAELIPGARLELIAGSGHQPFDEQPERFNGLVDAFWREH